MQRHILQRVELPGSTRWRDELEPDVRQSNCAVIQARWWDAGRTQAVMCDVVVDEVGGGCGVRN